MPARRDKIGALTHRPDLLRRHSEPVTDLTGVEIRVPAPAGAASPPSARRPSAHTGLCGEAKLRCHGEAVPEGLSKGIFRAPARGTFAPGGKSTKKRRSNLRFENPLRAFTCRLSCLLFPRERCAMQISPKYRIASASLFAAAFALKCKAVQFYIWCVGAGFYAVERSGTSALGVPPPAVDVHPGRR